MSSRSISTRQSEASFNFKETLTIFTNKNRRVTALNKRTRKPKTKSSIIHLTQYFVIILAFSIDSANSF